MDVFLLSADHECIDQQDAASESARLGIGAVADDRCLTCSSCSDPSSCCRGTALELHFQSLTVIWMLLNSLSDRQFRELNSLLHLKRRGPQVLYLPPKLSRPPGFAKPWAEVWVDLSHPFMPHSDGLKNPRAISSNLRVRSSLSCILAVFIMGSPFYEHGQTVVRSLRSTRHLPNRLSLQSD